MTLVLDSTEETVDPIGKTRLGYRDKIVVDGEKAFEHIRILGESNARGQDAMEAFNKATK